MAHRFKVHYTPSQVRQLLPRVREWLDEMQALAAGLVEMDKRIAALLGEGRDVGGPDVSQRIRSITKLNGLLAEFAQREIQIKDLQRGLLDFPALINGQEAFLCWEKSDPDLGHWHSLETGFSGRQPLFE